MMNAEHLGSEGRSISRNLLSELENSFTKNECRTSLKCGEKTYSYSELQSASNQLKNTLIQKGCRPGMRVVLLARHSFWLVASILAILKTGATYVPLDERTPTARLNFIVDNCGAEFAVFDKKNQSYFDQLNLRGLCVEDVCNTNACHPDYIAHGDDLAYILYTSGSTGSPKGVGISHSNLLKYVAWSSSAYFTDADDRIALYSTLTFDFTVTSIFPPLLAGASISIFDGITNPFVIQEIVSDESTNILKITPAYLHVLSELPITLSHLRRVIVGGEDLSANLAKKIQRRLRSSAEIINEYGPTEATVGCVTHVFDPEHDITGSVPIGLPIDDIEAIILDEDGLELSGVCTGELVISGANVAEGYIDLPHRTSEAFSDDANRPGKRLYRTGDLVRRQDDGTLGFLGRKDDQVKIRGNRVELGEVTSAILEIDAVKSAFVFSVPEHNTNALAALVVGEQGLCGNDVQAVLSTYLPAYMVPNIIKIVNEIPLSSNQKVDRTKILSLIKQKESTHDLPTTS